MGPVSTDVAIGIALAIAIVGMFASFLAGRISLLRRAQKRVTEYTNSITDARSFGPFTRCPMCDDPMMVACMQLDEETLTPGLWLLDVRCASCGTVYKSACPADQVIFEDTAEERENAED